MKENIFLKVKHLKKEQWLMCGLVGMLLLAAGMPVHDRKKDFEKNSNEKDMGTASKEDIRREYELQLEKVLSQVEGVGKVIVTVTMESTGRAVIEKDIPQEDNTSRDKDGEEKESSTYSKSTGETTVYEETDGGQQPYVASRIYPEIRGVVIVAQGGGHPELVCQIQEAAMALFHVEAHKIKVLKMR